MFTQTRDNSQKIVRFISYRKEFLLLIEAENQFKQLLNTELRENY